MSFLDTIFKFFSGITTVFTRIDHLIVDLEKLVHDVHVEVTAIKAFKEDPKWSSRVINVPKAFDTTKTFVLNVADEIHQSFTSLVSNLKAVAASSKAVGGVTPGGRSGVGTVLSYLTELNNFVNELDQGVLALDGFVQALRSIRHELETFDTLFLQQGNKRKSAQKKAFIRIGKLHGS